MLYQYKYKYRRTVTATYRRLAVGSIRGTESSLPGGHLIKVPLSSPGGPEA